MEKVYVVTVEYQGHYKVSQEVYKTFNQAKEFIEHRKPTPFIDPEYATPFRYVDERGMVYKILELILK